mgnify:CR=1 FL=1
MILPGATLGVLGGGQLGRMFALRARVMGYRIVVLEPEPNSPAGQVADEQITAAYDDPTALEQLAHRCDAVTTEFENVPAGALAKLAGRVVVAPPREAVAITQDRLSEKDFLRAHNFLVPPSAAVRSAAEAEAAFGAIGAPAILKTARLGYDGKGQVPVSTLAATVAALERFGGVSCILERRLNLESEVSVVLARGTDGAIETFPVSENVHRHGILHTSTVPARIGPELRHNAGALAAHIATALGYVGVLAVEMFVADQGRLYVNELAPRPHNSGHYTLDACTADQFEQQVRTLCGLPLGSPRLLAPCSMVNVLGESWANGTPHWERALALPGVRLHLYGKAVPRPGRKMGHLTCLASTADEALDIAERAHAALSG